MSLSNVKKRYCRYMVKWEIERPWLVSVRVETSKANCSVCQSTFLICGSGLSQVKIHETTAKHKINMDNFKSQRQFVNSGTLISLSKSLSEEEKVTTAEVLQALHFVEANYSFASAYSDSNRIRRMFPDYKIDQ